MSAGRLVVCLALLAASPFAVHAAHADSHARAATAELQVSVRVVSTCSIDSSAPQPVQCGRNEFVMVVRGAPIRRDASAGARIDSASDGQFSITTINF
jgi:hypothetical protein